MELRQTFKMAIRSIVDNKIRSVLTMLGVIIGVAAVITLVGVVDSATNYIMSTFDDVGANMITVVLTGRGNDEIKYEDIDKFLLQYPEYFKGVSPLLQNPVVVKNGTNTENTTLYGVNEIFKDVSGYKLEEGRFFTDVDASKNANVCVIGSYLRYELYGSENPVGQTIKVNGKEFKIVGLLEEKQNSSSNGNDNSILIPYSTATRFLRSKTTSMSIYYICAESSEVAEQAKNIFENFLASKVDDEYYTVVDMSAVLETIGDITGMLEMLLGGIAAISLVVGGIGIMNIMLVTVTERTREIGIRKAIGAKRKSILSQFLIESIVISGLGGIIGIIIGTLATIGIGKIMGIFSLPTLGVIMLAFSFSVAIGVFFGLYPANKASKLNPIDALRYQ